MFKVLGFAIICCFAIVGLNYNGSSLPRKPPEEKIDKSPNIMGIGCVVHLFDLRAYREKLLPSCQDFLEKNDPSSLITLLRESIEQLDAKTQLPGPRLGTNKEYEEAVKILSGSRQGKSIITHEDKRTFFINNVAPLLLPALCVPRDRGVNPEQNMGRTNLSTYLYERSEWIADLFTFARSVQGGTLKFELAIGESSELFTKNDIQQFNVELSQILPPGDPKLRAEYDNLRALVNLALEDPDLALLLSVL